MLLSSRDRVLTLESGFAAPRMAIYDHLAGLALAGALVLVFLTFADYGITHDEEVQAVYGEKLLAWYTSLFADRSAFEYLDLFWYGGVVDLAAAILNKVSPFGYYDTRHLLGGLIGVVGLAGAWRLGRLAAGPRTGLLALALLGLTPAYWGHCFNNPKDGPFAVAMLWLVACIVEVVRELPRPRPGLVVRLGLVLGLALSIRVGALLGVGYLGLAVLVHLALVARAQGWPAVRPQLAPILLRGLGAVAVAYAVVAVFWPWAVQSPLNPLRALQHFSGYDIDIETLVNGVKVKATASPADYVVVYLLVTMPELVLGGFALLVASLAFRSRAAGESHDAAALTVLATLFPIAYFVAVRPTAYDGLRHFLFVVPPLVVLAALGLNRAWIWAEAVGQRAVRPLVAALVMAGVAQLWIMARLHPNEYIYYNRLVGGVAGAEGKWELDYWSNSFHEAADKMAEIVRMENGFSTPTRVTKVGICGNDLSASYYFPPYLKLAADLEDAQFVIAFTQADCWKTWRGRTVAEVERFGAVLAVIKDRRGLPEPDKE